MWLSSSGTFTLIGFIPYCLWVGLGRSYTHSYQLVFTPYFAESWDGSEWAKWSPACVSVFSSECLIESMCYYIKGGYWLFWGFFFFCLWVLWQKYLHYKVFSPSNKRTWLLVQESFSSFTLKDISIHTPTTSIQLYKLQRGHRALLMGNNINAQLYRILKANTEKVTLGSN